MKKRIIRISLTIFLIISCISVTCFASISDTYTFYYEGREITIEGEGLSIVEAKTIADYIVYDITPAESIGLGESINTPLLCILFGHSTVTTTAAETIHNVYSTSPKCVRNYYSVEYCTRESCDYIQKTLTYSYRTAECHG